MATGKMMEDPMVSKEPMRDMTNAKKGTQQAVPKHANAMEVLTKTRLAPSDKPGESGICALTSLHMIQKCRATLLLTWGLFFSLCLTRPQNSKEAFEGP